MLDYAAAEARIGYVFNDKNLLETALTHSSFVNEHGGQSNERLEFLGDSLVNFLAAEALYAFGGDEGAMTERRKKLVSRTPLARAVLRMGLDTLLQTGRGESALSEKTVSNIFEAVAAAVYLDGGLEACRTFVRQHLEETDTVDYKSALQERVQKKFGNGQIAYKNTKEPPFVSTVLVKGMPAGVGTGRKLSEAEQAAAQDALNKLSGHTEFI